MAGLWLDVRATLASLDVVAHDPTQLDEKVLPALQYDLHCASEEAAGFAPPDDSAHLHEELACALAAARDATAEIGEAYAAGGADAVQPLVWEWRGALFRVRYARLRLQAAPPRAVVVAATAEAARTPGSVTASVVVLGSGLVLTAALLGLWVLVALTLAGTIAASFFLRP